MTTKSKYDSYWKSENMNHYEVTFEDGHIETVESVDEFTARMQCAHLKFLHGLMDSIEKIEKPNPKKKADAKPEKKTIPQYKKKADELLQVYGWQLALQVCMEFYVEYAHFPNQERSEFWKKVGEEVEKSSN